MRLNPGDICPRSGAYKVVDEDGKQQNVVHIQEGETMPPTQESGWHYEY